MHTFFLLLAILLTGLVAGGGAAVLGTLPPGGRRPLALLVLSSPLGLLGFGAYHVIPLFWMECSPLTGWDRVAVIGLLSAMGAVPAGAVVVNSVRLLLVERVLTSCLPLDHEPLRSRLSSLALRHGCAVPNIRLLETDAPLAVAGGLRQPAVVLSTWMIEQLDADELDAVFCHELAHTGRADYVVRWLSRLLRDATVYLPSSWYALSVVETDEELHADAQAVRVTGHPLAMASALGKVWHGALGAPAMLQLGSLAGYAGGGPTLLETRLTRLLNGTADHQASMASRGFATLGIFTLVGLAPRLLLVGAAALPLICMVRPD